MAPAWLRIVADDAPHALLRALDGPGPVAVVDHRSPLAGDALARTPRSALPDGTWLVARTSGSTRTPRTVCRTRESWLASVPAFAAATGTTAGHRVLVPGPLSSTLFLYAAWHARQVGAEPVLLPGGITGRPVDQARRWDIVHVVPHQLAALLDGVADDHDALAGRTAVVAGAALSEHLRGRAQRHGVRVVSYYGAAELSFVAMDDDTDLRAFPGARVAARDGEIWVHSPYLALDYLGAPETDGPWRRDAEGWSTVGDRGEVRTDGTLVVHGRGEKAVQTGGATVHVADVEAALRRHPEVADVVVVGLAHSTLGHVVAALVESPAATVGSLRAWAQTTLDAASRPRAWRVVASLPRTSAGKPDRRAAEVLLRQSRRRESVASSRSRP
jgi:acyl-CoA synthetase (AMP-forming)/AMP-acid ligase II